MSRNMSTILQTAAPPPFPVNADGWDMREAKASSFITRYGYHYADSVLRIEFKGGKKFNYPTAPPSAFGAMIAAPSVGTFFHSDIKNVFEAVEVIEDSPATAPLTS